VVPGKHNGRLLLPFHKHGERNAINILMIGSANHPKNNPAVMAGFNTNTKNQIFI